MLDCLRQAASISRQSLPYSVASDPHITTGLQRNIGRTSATPLLTHHCPSYFQGGNVVSSVAKDLWWLKWDIFHLNIELRFSHQVSYWLILLAQWQFWLFWHVLLLTLYNYNTYIGYLRHSKAYNNASEPSVQINVLFLRHASTQYARYKSPLL